MTTTITAILVFVAVAFGAVSMALLLEWYQERRRQRNLLTRLRQFDAEMEQRGGEGLLRAGERRSALVQALASRAPALIDLELGLQQAGVKWTVESFLLTSAGLGVAFGLATLTFTRSYIGAIIAAAIAGMLPHLSVRRKRALRVSAFEAQLPEAIDLLGRAIRAGHPLSSGLKMVADETQDPIATEFRRTFEEQRFGLPFDDALMAMVDRVDLVDVRILVTAILIQREVGGNLAEVLDNLASVIRARFTIRRQLRVYTAQGRISGYVLAVLPIAVGSIIYLLNPEYTKLLFTESLGRVMLITAIVMQIIGYLWIRKIVNIDI